MDTTKLFRLPLTDRKWDNPGEVSFASSPDNKYRIAFSHFFEIRMSTYRGLFNLLDENGNVIDGFEPLTTYGTNTSYWNDESSMFVVAIDQFNYGYFFVKVPELEIAFIKVANPYPLNVHFKGNLFILSYNDNSLSTKNSVQTFGGGPLEIPSKIYLKPQDLQIPLDKLTFYPRARLCDLELLTRKSEEYQLEPIDDGFRDFKGKFPQHTSEIYNTRQFEVYQLEAFAEYGDPQSIQWLNDIRKKTNGNYSKWKKVIPRPKQFIQKKYFVDSNPARVQLC